jgi:nucleotide-binding universal stress UspA family protein
MNDFKAMCGQLDCKVHFHRDWTVDAGIRHLSEGIGADLIAISNEQRHPLKRIFTGSNVEALVNHSDIPVLSIDRGVEA